MCPNGPCAESLGPVSAVAQSGFRDDDQRAMHRFWLAALAWLSACSEGAPPPATFVGRSSCAECHATEHDAWTGSHHDLAMQHARPETVLGDFGDATFSHGGVTSKFYRDGDRFMVRTDGPGGSMHDYAIDYVFGVEPLQQYLVEFPGGRYQALGIAWDSRPESAGGQRWFHLYPDETVPHDDVLHWTQRSQNWNRMCADCHSTNLRKGYDAATDSYDTTWSELDVSCEACHGPASNHVVWARAGGGGGDDSGFVVSLRNRGVWAFAEGAKTATRTEPPPSRRSQVETCAYCHSRRTPVHDGFEYGKSFLDSHRLAFLDEPLYWPDGQIRDEVYVYGSFAQSKMYAAGVTCSDCHEPHGLGLLAEGNALCVRCHSAAEFDSPSHYHHAAGSEGASCVACHMPETTYMVVDPRRDHSIRIPRPELSAATGAPNACTGCHEDQTSGWAASAIAEWVGDRDAEPHWSADSREPYDPSRPAIVRGTAFAQLEQQPSRDGLRAAAGALASEDPLVRLGAVQGLGVLDPENRAVQVGPMLDDPVRTVRIEAARVLADARGALEVEAAARLDRVLDEYRDAQALHADEPWAHVNLGNLAMRTGDQDAAEKAYRQALVVEPRFVPAHVNLVDLHRARGRDDLGEAALRRAIAAVPDQAVLHHTLGLLFVRQKRVDEAVAALAEAASLEPNEPDFSYFYAVALHSRGQIDEAIRVLERSHSGSPRHPDTLHALATFERDRGGRSAALAWARKLTVIDPSARALVRELERGR